MLTQMLGLFIAIENRITDIRRDIFLTDQRQNLLMISQQLQHIHIRCQKILGFHQFKGPLHTFRRTFDIVKPQKNHAHIVPCVSLELSRHLTVIIMRHLIDNMVIILQSSHIMSVSVIVVRREAHLF